MSERRGPSQGGRSRAEAIILSVGTELTEGITQDLHVRFLASELSSVGLCVRRAEQLPDDEAVLRSELARACSEAAVVLVTGGLGPTTDDLTREAVAGAAGVRLVFHPGAWEQLVARFNGRRVPETNRKQATAPEGFALLPNPNGTAPGFHGTIGSACLFALPGPPRELRPMFGDSVLPMLRQRFGLGREGETLWATACMVGESALEEALQAERRPGVSWGTRVEEDRIAFSLRGGDDGLRSAVLRGLKERLGEARIRDGDRRPAEILLEALASTGRTLATAESCTGGLLGRYLTDVPGSSRVFWGGVVAYANEAKTELLGVDPGLIASHGAVSAEVARAMAAGILARSGASAAIAVSGTAGPDGGTPEKPVGTVWIATSLVGGPSRESRFSFSGSRDQVRRKASVSALLAAEAAVRGAGFLDSPAAW